MDIRTMEIETGFYKILTAGSKKMIKQLGGEVALSFSDAEWGLNTKCEIRFIGDKENPNLETDYWLFRLVEGEPPDEPEKVDEQQQDI